MSQKSNLICLTIIGTFLPSLVMSVQYHTYPDDSTVLVALGFAGLESPYGFLNSVEILDFANETVCSTSDALYKTEGSVGVLLKETKNVAMFCGGFDGDNFEYRNECQSLHNNETWTQSPSLVKSFRRDAALVQFAHGILVTGGFPSDSSIEFFDGQAWNLLKTKLPNGLYGHCAVSL